MAFVTLPTALVTHLLNAANQPGLPTGYGDAATSPDATPPAGGAAPVTPGSTLAGAQGAAYGPAGSGGERYGAGIKYPSSNTGGPDDIWQAANAGPWNYFTGGPYAPNAGQVDNYGNVYNPVVAGSWGGGYVDPKSLPGSSTVNAQLWGGPTSDSPPAWLQQIVQQALGMSGADQAAREKHIMDSLLTPGAGANQHDLGYVERMFGITA